MSEFSDITARVRTISVVGHEAPEPIDAYTDGHRLYFDEANISIVGRQLTGSTDLAGRIVQVQRDDSGWHERRGNAVPRQLRRRLVQGKPVYRVDDEWLFTEVRAC